MMPPRSASKGREAERRRYSRYFTALDVECGPATASGEAPAEDELERTITVNVSQGGVCVYSGASYPIGAQLFCALHVPGRAKPVKAVGTVAWFQKLDREKGYGYKFGIEFTRISADDQRALSELLDHPPAVSASRAKTLLLVDDDPELQLALKLRFESEGFRVITAGAGLEALRKGREEHPNLIILDVMIPQLSGYEVCRLLKFDQKFRHIPVIFCTARCRREDLELGKAVGADAYITKPFNGKDLIAKVEELLQARHE